MAKTMQDFQTPPIMFTRWSDGFGEFQYGAPLAGPFELANPIQAMQIEAGAKGMGIWVQVALVPLEAFFGQPEEEESHDGSGTEVGQPG